MLGPFLFQFAFQLLHYRDWQKMAHQERTDSLKFVFTVYRERKMFDELFGIMLG